jgi:hypothetical protein
MIRKRGHCKRGLFFIRSQDVVPVYRGVNFCICIVPMPVCIGFAGTGVVERVALDPRVRVFATDDDATATIFIGRIMSLSS